MCFPLAAAIGPLVGAMSSIGSGVMGLASSQQQYGEQSKQYAQNVANAEADARVDYTREGANEMENNEQYAEKQQLNLIEGAQKQSSAEAAAATSGVAGNVVPSIINGIGTAVSMKGATLTKQWQANAEQTAAEKLTTTSQENMRIGSEAPPIEPSPVGAVIGAVGAGLKFAGGLSGNNSNFFGVSSGSSSAPASTSSVDDSGGIGHM